MVERASLVPPYTLGGDGLGQGKQVRARSQSSTLTIPGSVKISLASSLVEENSDTIAPSGRGTCMAPAAYSSSARLSGPRASSSLRIAIVVSVMGHSPG